MLSTYTILHKLHVAGKHRKWVMDLTKFDIEYKSHILITKVLMDSLTELSKIIDQDPTKDEWILETDESLHKIRGRKHCSIITQRKKGNDGRSFIFPISNNKVEYEVVLLLENSSSFIHQHIEVEKRLLVSGLPY